MEAESVTVKAYGVSSLRLTRAACRACFEAGFSPCAAFTINNKLLVISEEGGPRMLYARIRPENPADMEWTLFPNFFSKRTKSDAIKAIRRHLTAEYNEPSVIKITRPRNAIIACAES